MAKRKIMRSENLATELSLSMFPVFTQRFPFASFTQCVWSSMKQYTCIQKHCIIQPYITFTNNQKSSSKKSYKNVKLEKKNF